MITDEELRSQFEAALEEVTPPAPWLSTSIENAWRASHRPGRRRRVILGFRVSSRVVAAGLLIALALSTTAVFVAIRLATTSPVPASPSVPIPGVLKATQQCFPRFVGTPRMFSASTGWAAGLSGTDPAGVEGPYRTTDGGNHWTDVAPPQIPDQTDFTIPGSTQGPWQFLDGSDAWVVKIGGSAGVYSDHVVVFSTTDGGTTWRQSQPMQLTPARPDDFIKAAMCFIDPQDGFLALGSGPLGQSGQPDMTVSAFYRTSDGGLHWQWISDPDVQARKSGLRCLFDGMAFSSPQDGWIRGECPVVFVTHDGGATWSLQDSGAIAYFFDSTHGVVEYPPLVSNSPSRYPIATSSDGGLTWATRGVVPISGCFAVFVDTLHGWCIVNPGSIDPAAGKPADAEIYRTVDGGRSWSLASRMGTNGAWIALDFLSAKVGFLSTGTNPAQAGWRFFKTADGGFTWSHVPSSVSG
jgi:photosystem II stability/assembly factor-like uncharacterized protein